MWRDLDAFAEAATRRCLRVWNEVRAAQLVLTLGESLWVLGTPPGRRADVRALVADLREGAVLASDVDGRLDALEPPEDSPTLAEEVAADGWSVVCAWARGDRPRDALQSFYFRALASILLVGDVLSEARDAWLLDHVELVASWLVVEPEDDAAFATLWSRYEYVAGFFEDHYGYGVLSAWRAS